MLASVAGMTLAEQVQSKVASESVPLVQRRAGELLKDFTRGTCELIVENGDVRALQPSEGTARFELEELSDGTRAQLFIAVRLAFVEQGEQGLQLPLFFGFAPRPVFGAFHMQRCCALNPCHRPKSARKSPRRINAMQKCLTLAMTIFMGVPWWKRQRKTAPGIPPGAVGGSARPQGSVLSTSRMVSKMRSMCAFSMISGGDRAMVSPVVRIRTPFS